MVVDHIEQHHQAVSVRNVDQRLQIFWTTVAGVRREWQRAVITPVAAPLEIRKRHQLQGGEADVRQVCEPPAHAGIVSARAEGADVRLVHHGLAPCAATPCGMLPSMAVSGDHLAGAVDVVGLKARRRIRHPQAVRQQVTVAVARPRTRAEAFEPPAVELLHRQDVLSVRRVAQKSDSALGGCPQMKAHAVVFDPGTE